MRFLSLTLGYRFNRGRRRGGMVSLISVISTLGIALGVAVLIIGLSSMNGFQRELENRVLAVVPHGELTGQSGQLANWQSMQQKVDAVKGVVASAPYVQFTGLLEHGVNLKGVQLKGVDPQLESQISRLPQFVQGDAWGRFNAGESQVILGKGLADALKVTQGDWVTVMVPHNDPSMKLRQPQRIRLQVSGLLALSGQLDHSMALIPLADAQQYREMGSKVTGLAIKVADVFAANPIIRAAGIAANEPLYVKTWISSFGYMYRDIQMIRAIMYLAMILVIGVACFNIVSTLVMAVKEKSSDIAVLRTLGANDRLIRRIFIIYGLFTGLMGSVIGALLGSLIAWKLTDIMRLIERLTGHQMMSGDIYFVDFLPSELHGLDVFIVLVTALLLSLLASWYPARRASNINPARVLSGH